MLGLVQEDDVPRLPGVELIVIGVAADVAELTHGSLWTAEGVHAHAHRDGAVDAAVDVTARRETCGLEG